jgi:hypothetical protein
MTRRVTSPAAPALPSIPRSATYDCGEPGCCRPWDADPEAGDAADAAPEPDEAHQAAWAWLDTTYQPATADQDAPSLAVLLRAALRKGYDEGIRGRVLQEYVRAAERRGWDRAAQLALHHGAVTFAVAVALGEWAQRCGRIAGPCPESSCARHVEMAQCCMLCGATLWGDS